jgi:hypothetical protein
MKNLCGIGLVVFFCVGCATRYESVPLEEPHSTISFQRNEAGVKAVNDEPMQGYEVMDNPECDNMETVAWFSWNSEFKETARFPANGKLHFFIHSVKNIPGPRCYSYLGFKPAEGGQYVVMHKSCEPVVYDTSGDNWRPVEDIDVINGFECPKKNQSPNSDE